MKNLLRQIIRIPPLYGCFLNTLSMLEYIGARKILKSQQQEALSEKMLAHISEEIRHALVLKRAALKLAPTVCESYAPEALLCGKEACEYFQAVDHAAAKEFNLQDTWHAYLFTTFLIENRAITFYTLCQEVLHQYNMPSIFRRILVEEDRHLKEIQDWIAELPGATQKLAILREVEEQEFNKWYKACEALLAASTETVMP